ncbi:D-sedoheptulose 7-phosphate isomerase [Azotosporobacter soli]|uniref:D-sedoheptulose-7-phosphate isomerase n=1 Tax=Azotosporobacter soli TaxID=3055040 RepID=UPI0031FEA0E6
MKNLLDAAFDEHQQTIDRLRRQSDLILQIAQVWRVALKNGNKILFCGNGGSAADCQHLAAELVGRFVKERKGLPGIALTTDTSILTAVGNDYGFDRVFSRQVEALGRPGDVLVGISTSGNSPNVLAAMAEAKKQGMITVGFSGGTGGKLNGAADVCLVVEAATTARVQEGHILVGHLLCQLCDEE